MGLAFSRDAKERTAKFERAELHKSIGKSWTRDAAIPPLVREHWATLVRCFHFPIEDQLERAHQWKAAALALVAITDEAFADAGYFPPGDDGIANYIWYELIQAMRKKPVALELPHSVTIYVPNDIACVLPKALTPDVGCTLRSLTHNLAFLPGKGIVRPEWLVHSGSADVFERIRARRKHKTRNRAPEGVFNILLIPFPYVIHATDFKISRPSEGEADGYFTLSQDWLRDGSKNIPTATVTSFIGSLIHNAQREIGSIHAVVLPEVALTKRLADAIAMKLAKRFRTLELFVTGATLGRPPAQRNIAAQYSMVDGEVVRSVEQSKHHRWLLEANQIRQYHLGGALDPNFRWWEHIDVQNRRIGFAVNSQDAIVSALVCEDLARYDPVLPTVTAVGPTLVIALLMDGPQLSSRWPARYATVLAEDPGSSVLTLTNAGMVERSAMPADHHHTVVGLWKDRHGAAKELVLPKHHHALALSLNCYEKTQRTLDHRVDSEPTTEYRLGACRAVRLDRPPAWLERRAGSA
jgi:hypothetical protein